MIVSGRVPDKDASKLLPIVEQLNARSNACARAHPGYHIAATGLSVIAARNSAGMINKLNRGLTHRIRLSSRLSSASPSARSP